MAHGVDVTQFDLITYKEMLLMYAHGFIGNRKMMELAATQLGTIMNYLMGGKKSMGMRDILGSTWDFWDTPKTPQELEEISQAKTRANLNTFFMAYGGSA